MSNKYLLAYCYRDKNGLSGFGSVVVNQDNPAPITYEVLKDALRIVRELNGFSDDTQIAPLTWTRFEA